MKHFLFLSFMPCLKEILKKECVYIFKKPLKGAPLVKY